MGSWQVFYESRQTECCGTPFSVGDEVTWPLRPTTPDEPLAVGTHGGKWPETTGRVREIRVVGRRYAPVAPGSRTREPVPGEQSRLTADSCPKWCNTGESRAREDLVESGVLAMLDIAGATPQEPRDPC